MKKLINKKIVLIIGIFVVLVSVVAFIYTRQYEIVVLQTSPFNGSSDVLETTNIEITFDKTLKEKDKQSISLEITPKAQIATTWLGYQLTTVLVSPLKNGTSYLVVVKYNGKETYRFSFETILFSREQIQKEGALQSTGDKAFGDAYTKFINSSPWYIKIPIEKPNYTIVYSFEKNSFRISLKITPQNPDERKTIIQNALRDLKAIGVKEPVQYYVIEL